jgi:hypothetical protein
MWKKFEELLSPRTSRSEAGMPTQLEGKHLHYLSRTKIRTLAAELNISEEQSATTSYSLGLKGSGVGQQRVHAKNSEWPVSLAKEVTARLIRDARVSAVPDFSKRYFAGRMYMIGGTLGSTDLKPEGAWFVGSDGANAIFLCGSATHLRDRTDNTDSATWYPSRLESLSLVVRSLVSYSQDGTVDGSPDYLRMPGKSHRDTMLALMEVISSNVMRGDPFLEEWVDFLALRHFVIPGLGLEQSAFSQVVLGSPLWVASSDELPPPGWYPDPALGTIQGSARWWDGTAWSELSYTNGTQLETPVPTVEARPTGWLVPGKVWWKQERGRF